MLRQSRILTSKMSWVHENLVKWLDGDSPKKIFLSYVKSRTVWMEIGGREWPGDPIRIMTKNNDQFFSSY